MQNFLEGQLFANICNAFSALGTVGAVIISLYLIFRENNVKYKMSGSITGITNYPYPGNNTSGYGVNIVNLSYNKNIMLKQSLYVKQNKERALLLLLNLKLPEIFITPSVLGPGEDFTFFIEKKQIEYILKNVPYKKIELYYLDKCNKKYSIKVKREDLKIILEKNGN